MKIKFHRHNLRLKTPFKLSRNTTSVRKSLIVELTDGELSGYGEVTDNKYYPQAEPDVIQKQLSAVIKAINFTHALTPEELYDKVLKLELWNKQPNFFAISALDTAFHQLIAKRANKTIYQHLNLKWEQHKIPVSNYTLSVDTPQNVLKQALNNPWPAYKVKLGGQYDIETLQLLQENIPNTQWCVDANAGWTEEEAKQKIKQLSKLSSPIEFIEQPLKKGKLEATRRLKSFSPLPLIADEDCQTEQDVKACLESYHGINIKVVKCGGITPALRMIEYAKQKKGLVMIGCMVESSFGIQNLANLAPLTNFLDLDGHLLIQNDPGPGVDFDKYGRVLPPI